MNWNRLQGSIPLHGTGAAQKPALRPQGAHVLAPAHSQQRGRGLLPWILPAPALRLEGSTQGTLHPQGPLAGAWRGQGLSTGVRCTLGSAARWGLLHARVCCMLGSAACWGPLHAGVCCTLGSAACWGPMNAGFCCTLGSAARWGPMNTGFCCMSGSAAHLAPSPPPSCLPCSQFPSAAPAREVSPLGLPSI